MSVSTLSFPAHILSLPIYDSHVTLVCRRLQEEFVQTLTSEQVTFDEQVTKALYPAAIAFQKIPHYEAKIKKMAKQMQSISQRVAKLKQRATLIQTNAHKQASKKR